MSNKNIVLFNTQSKRKELFIPICEGNVSVYTCGPTVYNFAHVGNLRTYIFEDLLKRVLLYNGLTVNHVMNITDVGHLTSDSDDGEDKMEKGSKREGLSIWEIAKKYEQAFFNDCNRLNIVKPNVVCRATEHIFEQIEFIKILENKGFTYQTSDGIYFDTSKFEKYSDFAKLDVKGLSAGKRISIGDKRNFQDFALWKFLVGDNSNHIMNWDSPWGKGFPGWHIECSAMAMKYLGNNLDIHCGGVDHIPVHHTNEIAQSEAILGHKWVNYWLHGEFLVTDKEKMSKSSGEFLTLDYLLRKGFDPLDYRYFCLSAHYRGQLTFTWEALEHAKRGFNNLKKEFLRLESSKDFLENDLSKVYKEKFIEQINDDLNIPEALATTWKVIRDSKLEEPIRRALVLDFDKILGLGLSGLEKKLVIDAIPSDILELVELRKRYKQERNWKESDNLRLEIENRGFRIVDNKDGEYQILKI